MNSVKILHTADLHIGAKEFHLGAQSQTRRFETVFTFEAAVKKALDEEVKLFLIAGDLFDSNRVEDVFAERVFEAMKSAPQIAFVLSCGNHDPLSADSPLLRLKTPDNLHILPACDSVIEFENLGVRVYGHSFDSVYKKGEEHFSLTPPNDDKVNIMCIHGEFKGDANSGYNPISTEFIEKSGMDYIALGHEHNRSSIAKIGNTFAAYSGCIEGHGFDEIGDKGALIGTISKEKADLIFYSLCRRKYIIADVDATDKEDITGEILKALKEKCGESFRENIFKIILSGGISEDLKFDKREISGRIANEVFFAKILDRTSPKLDIKMLAKEQSLRGIFARKCLERLEKTDEKLERAIIMQAMSIGLKAFTSEVKCDEI